MQRLFSLILFFVCLNLSAETVTYIVNSRTSVRTDGDVLEGSVISFSQTSTTGKVGQMTAGNCSTLKIKNMPHVIISDITLIMHSNASGGAGELIVKKNNQIVAQIEDDKFSSPWWYGEYTNNNVEVEVPLDKQVVFNDGDSLIIDICASANSLYIVSYSITYKQPNAAAYTVRLHTGINDEVIIMHETSPNIGVMLPNTTDVPKNFKFIGWTNNPIEEAVSCPQTYRPYSTFYPKRNMSLFAVYLDETSANQLWHQTTEFKSGYYLLADTWEHCLAYGELNKDKHLDVRVLPEWTWNSDSLRCYIGSEVYIDEIYYIDFISDTELTIYNVYHEIYINPSKSENSTDLSSNQKQPTAWTYTHYPYHQLSLSYTYLTGTKRYLQATEALGYKGDKLYFYATERGYSSYGITLFNIDDIPTTTAPFYTSYPTDNTKDSVDNVEVSEVEIKEDKVINKTNSTIRLYTTLGVEVRASETDLSLQGLPTGVYIITYCSGSQRVILR